MILNSYAYYRTQKQFVYIVGMKNLEAEFNSNGRLFTVRMQNDGRAVAKRSELEPIQNIPYIKTDSDRYIPTTEFSWQRHAFTTPVKTIPVVKLKYKAGDHVKLKEHDNYFARVLSGKVNNYLQAEYSVAYYSQINLKADPRYRIPKDNTTTMLEVGLEALTTPAPRVAADADLTRKITAKFQRNMESGNYKGSWRIYAESPQSALNAITYYKERGALLAKLMASAREDDLSMLSRWEDLRNIVSNIRLLSYPADYVKKITDVCSSVSNYFEVCSNCGEVDLRDEFHYADSEGISFCSHCDHQFTWSDLMDDYVSDDNCVDVYEDVDNYFSRSRDGIATYNWLRDSGEYIEYNGVGLHESIHAEVSENDEGNGSGLNEYHNTRRIWKEVWADKAYLPLGVELEVYAEPRRAAVMAVANACKGEVYLERDGSLNRDYGFEVITQPFGKSEWETFGHKMLNTLKGKGAVAWSEPAGQGYGIHVNISRAYLSALQEARMFMFLAAVENVNFVRAIAQRSKIYNADLSMGKTSKAYQKMRYMGGLQSIPNGRDDEGRTKYKKVLTGRGKYAPIKLHEDRMEIRIFQSTLNTLSFYKNLEFTWALLEWTSTKSSTGTSWLHVDFLKWLVARPHAEKDYPNLLAYLRKPVYKLSDEDEDEEDCPSEVSSTWSDLMPKPNRSSVAVEVTRATNDETKLYVVPAVVVPTSNYALAA